MSNHVFRKVIKSNLHWRKYYQAMNLVNAVIKDFYDFGWKRIYHKGSMVDGGYHDSGCYHSYGATLAVDSDGLDYTKWWVEMRIVTGKVMVNTPCHMAFLEFLFIPYTKPIGNDHAFYLEECLGIRMDFDLPEEYQNLVDTSLKDLDTVYAFILEDMLVKKRLTFSWFEDEFRDAVNLNSGSDWNLKISNKDTIFSNKVMGIEKAGHTLSADPNKINPDMVNEIVSDYIENGRYKIYDINSEKEGIPVLRQPFKLLTSAHEDYIPKFEMCEGTIELRFAPRDYGRDEAIRLLNNLGRVVESEIDGNTLKFRFSENEKMYIEFDELSCVGSVYLHLFDYTKDRLFIGYLYPEIHSKALNDNITLYANLFEHKEMIFNNNHVKSYVRNIIFNAIGEKYFGYIEYNIKTIIKNICADYFEKKYSVNDIVPLVDSMEETPVKGIDLGSLPNKLDLLDMERFLENSHIEYVRAMSLKDKKDGEYYRIKLFDKDIDAKVSEIKVKILNGYKLEILVEVVKDTDDYLDFGLRCEFDLKNGLEFTMEEVEKKPYILSIAVFKALKAYRKIFDK